MAADSNIAKPQPTVLIIEDDDAVARCLARILGKLFQVERGRSLKEGLQLIERIEYAALICDWDLGDGIGVLALIRSAERNPDALRVLYTARLASEVAPSLPAGAAHVILEKPSAPKAIVGVLCVGVRASHGHAFAR